MKNSAIAFSALVVFCGLLAAGSFSRADPPPPADGSAVQLIEALGCRGCHRIQGYGGSLAANLTDVGNRLTATEINAVLTSHSATRGGNFMPSYRTLTPAEVEQLSSYLYHLQ